LKKLIFTFLVYLSWNHLSAQDNVEVIVDPAVQAMEEARIATNKNAGIKIYRIMVAFYPERSAANDKLSEVKSWFGDRYSSIVQFDEPNFKVYVGEFTSKIDADAALVDVKRKYPTARIVNDYLAPRKRN
jgi:hypothetical protein